MDDGLERSRALAVDDPEFGDAAAQALADVLGDEVLDVLRAERVEIEDAVDDELDGIVGEVGGIAGLVRHAPMLT